jgi:hypothetical protein
MTLGIFNSNTKNHTILDKNDNTNKIELIKVQNDDKSDHRSDLSRRDTNNESAVKSQRLDLKDLKQTKPKISRENKIELTNENQEFLNSLTKDPTVTKQTEPKKSREKKIELTKENQDFLNALKTGSGFKIIPKYSV